MANAMPSSPLPDPPRPAPPRPTPRCQPLLRYRTQLCNDGPSCSRAICFFAHSLDELRTPAAKPYGGWAGRPREGVGGRHGEAGAFVEGRCAEGSAGAGELWPNGRGGSGGRNGQGLGVLRGLPNLLASEGAC